MRTLENKSGRVMVSAACVRSKHSIVVSIRSFRYHSIYRNLPTRLALLCIMLTTGVWAQPMTQSGPLAQAQSAPSRAPAAAVITGSDPQQTVRVSDIPPLSITKDWTDRAYWVFTLFLVAVGGLQVFLLWGNLRAIERQAIQMERQTGILEKTVAVAEKNAETARQNVELFVSRERAHLRVELMPLAWPLPAGTSRLKYKITHYGTTEAYITGSCARAEITGSTDPHDDGHWWPAMSIPQVITPNEKVIEAEVHGIFPTLTLDQAEVDAIDAGQRFIHFRGFVRYNDVFGTERLTRIRRVWQLAKLRNPDGSRSGHWNKTGSAKDNSET